MFGALELLFGSLSAAAVRIQAVCRAVPLLQVLVLPLRLSVRIVMISPLLDAHVVSCLVLLAQLCVNTQSSQPARDTIQVPPVPSPSSCSPTATASGTAGTEPLPAGPVAAPPCSSSAWCCRTRHHTCCSTPASACWTSPATVPPCSRRPRKAVRGCTWCRPQPAGGRCWLLLQLQVAIADAGRREDEAAIQGVGGRQEQEQEQGQAGAEGGAVDGGGQDRAGA